jgi:hypothetical protein
VRQGVKSNEEKNGNVNTLPCWGRRDCCLIANIHTKFWCYPQSVGGKTLDEVIAFHAKLGIPTKSRSVRKDDAWYSLYCFADRDKCALSQ